MKRTVYVIVFEDFGQNTPKLYYNSENDTWARDPRCATKFAKRSYANILREVINLYNYCRVEKFEVE